MKRRDFLTATTAGVLMAGTSVSCLGRVAGGNSTAVALSNTTNKLTPPAKGKIPVLFAISDGVTVIDFAGPWEVFQDTQVTSQGRQADDNDAFELFTVSEKIEPIKGSGGLKLVPDYTFANAPQPKVVVVPAQRGSEELRGWLKKVSKTTDVTMSVCTGAFQLAKAGLLSGRVATTHHDFIDQLEKSFPDVEVKRGVRFVEGDIISTAGGLSSGIDLALRIVDRYFGRETAQATATYMEYQSKGWIV
jgi:transcriptional regulator GlxA family with amidase domain